MQDLDPEIQAILEANDGVDANGLPNGERDLLRQIQGVLSRLLQDHQPAANSTSTAAVCFFVRVSTRLARRLLSALGKVFASP